MNLNDIKNIYIEIMRKKVKEIYKEDNILLEERLKFVLGRFDEGEGIASYIKSIQRNSQKDKIRILDAGCGSGELYCLWHMKKYLIYMELKYLYIAR